MRFTIEDVRRDILNLGGNPSTKEENWLNSLTTA